jgi:phosphoribosyl 1,2-cyclic phosphodiesterase
MSLELCILGSGSSGNSTLLRSRRGRMLIDIGFGPRSTAKRLAGTGVAVEEITAICLTHLDHDHFNRNWIHTIIRQAIRVYCHHSLIQPILDGIDRDGCRDELPARLRSLMHPFDGDPFAPLEDVRAQAISLPHDRAGSHGFVVESSDCRLGYATDLGSVPAALFDLFDNLDVLALECNYDPRMQMTSDRPWVLKQRVMGGAGHLSNQQSFAAVRHILNRCEKRGEPLPAHIVLLHRSRQCNCPDLVRSVFSQDARIPERLILAEQHERSEWIRARRPERLSDTVSGVA